MGKTLMLVRHAKSSWSNETSSDFDRSLNDRGKRDAPAMAKRLKAKDVEIDTIVSSPAKRAKKTAEFFAEEFNIHADKIIYKTELYAAPPDSFAEVLKSLNKNVNHIALFSHNPGVTEFANTLTDTRIDDMPTCAIFAIKLELENWSDFEIAIKKFWFFDYPKHPE